MAVSWIAWPLHRANEGIACFVGDACHNRPRRFLSIAKLIFDPTECVLADSGEAVTETVLCRGDVNGSKQSVSYKLILMIKLIELVLHRHQFGKKMGHCDFGLFWLFSHVFQ